MIVVIEWLESNKLSSKNRANFVEQCQTKSKHYHVLVINTPYKNTYHTHRICSMHSFKEIMLLLIDLVLMFILVIMDRFLLLIVNLGDFALILLVLEY